MLMVNTMSLFSVELWWKRELRAGLEPALEEAQGMSVKGSKFVFLLFFLKVPEVLYPHTYVSMHSPSAGSITLLIP